MLLGADLREAGSQRAAVEDRCNLLERQLDVVGACQQSRPSDLINETSAPLWATTSEEASGRCGRGQRGTVCPAGYGSVAELADAPDSSPGALRGVRVRLPPLLPNPQPAHTARG